MSPTVSGAIGPLWHVRPLSNLPNVTGRRHWRAAAARHPRRLWRARPDHERATGQGTARHRRWPVGGVPWHRWRSPATQVDADHAGQHAPAVRRPPRTIKLSERRRPGAATCVNGSSRRGALRRRRSRHLNTFEQHQTLAPALRRHRRRHLSSQDKNCRTVASCCTTIQNRRVHPVAHGKKWLPDTKGLSEELASVLARPIEQTVSQFTI